MLQLTLGCLLIAAAAVLGFYGTQLAREGWTDVKGKNVSSVLKPATKKTDYRHLPGMSLHAFLRISHLPVTRRKYIFDFGQPTGERLSVYLSSDNVFTLCFVDAKREPHPIQLPIGTIVPLGEFFYLACEVGDGGQFTAIRVAVNGIEAGKLELPFRADIGALDVPGGVVGADLEGNNGAAFDMQQLALYTVTQPDVALTQLNQYFRSKEAGGFVKFSGQQWMRVGQVAAKERNMDMHQATESLRPKLSSQSDVAPANMTDAEAKGPQEPARPARTPSGNVDIPINGGIHAAAVGLDGKIYLTGSFSAVGGEIHVGVARLNVDGTVDSTFRANVAAGGFSFGFFADGSFILNSAHGGILNFSREGIRNIDFPAINGLRCLHVNKDETFYASSGKYTKSGKLIIPFSESTEAMSMALQPDGKILIGGPNGKLLRLKTDGTRDITFTPPEGILGGNVHGIGVQADGKIVVSGGAFALLPNIFRLNNDGTVDKLFKCTVTTYGPLRCLEDGSILVSSGANSTEISIDQKDRFLVTGTLTRIAKDGSLHGSQPILDGTFSSVPGIGIYLPIH